MNKIFVGLVAAPSAQMRLSICKRASNSPKDILKSVQNWPQSHVSVASLCHLLACRVLDCTFHNFCFAYLFRKCRNLKMTQLTEWMETSFAFAVFRANAAQTSPLMSSALTFICYSLCVRNSCSEVRDILFLLKKQCVARQTDRAVS